MSDQARQVWEEQLRESLLGDGGVDAQLNLAPFAVWVVERIHMAGARDKWRTMIRACAEGSHRRYVENKTWTQERSGHFLRARSTPNWKARDKPPEPDWVWEFESVLTVLDEPTQTLSCEYVHAWVPPHLARRRQPVDISAPLPLSAYRELTLVDCYAVLASIHDAVVKGAEQINPWANEPPTMWLKGWYAGQCREASNLRAAEQASLENILRRVQNDLEPLIGETTSGQLKGQGGNGGTDRNTDDRLDGRVHSIADAPPNTIVRRGPSWEICFGEEQGTFPHTDYLALEIVAKVLARPLQPCSITELVTARERPFLEHRQADDFTQDSRAIADLKTKYEELQRDRAKYANDPLAVEEIAEEMAKIAAELSKAVGLGRRKRKLGSTPADRIWEALTRRLRRLWPRLRDNGMPLIAAHLTATIHIDRPSIIYRPSPGTPPWHVEA